MNVMLPALQRTFHATTAWSTWVVTAFLLVGAVATPLIGSFGDQHGRSRVLRITLVVFALSSLGAASAPSLGLLIAFRALCGVSGAFLALGVALIAEYLPPARGPGAIAAIAGSMAAANVAAVTVSPMLSEAVSWRAVFLANTALALGALALSLRTVPRAASREKRPIDVPGAALLGISIASLMLVFTEANVWGWTSPPILALIAGSCVSGGAWVCVELRVAQPLIDLRMLTRRTVLLTNATIALAGAGVFSSLVLVPRLVAAPEGVPASLLSRVHYGFGASTTEVGLFLLPQMVIAVIASTVLGAIGRRFGGWKIPLVAVVVTLALGLAMLGRWHAHVWQITLAMMLLGLSIMLSSIGAKIVADDVRPSEYGVAAGLNMVAFYIGGVIGTQGVAAILSGRLIPGTSVPTDSAYSLGFYVLAAAVLLSIPLALLVHPRERVI